MEMRAIQTAGAERTLGDGAFYALALLLVFIAYWIVLALTGPGDLLHHAASSIRNLVPLIILGAAAQAVIRAFLMKWRTAAQFAGHIGLGLTFSFLWYWLLMVLIGLSTGESPTRFSVQPFFPNPAVAWQLLQGLTFYALLAALTYLRAQPPLPGFVVTKSDATADSAKEPNLSRYFIRQGEDIHPIEVSQIVSIAGADDYAEVSTMTGRHLVRMTLSDFKDALEDDRFIRVHRSHIVNLDRIVRAEPAGGGRMHLHMENGEIVAASRTGTKLLRDRVI